MILYNGCTCVVHKVVQRTYNKNNILYNIYYYCTIIQYYTITLLLISILVSMDVGVPMEEISYTSPKLPILLKEVCTKLVVHKPYVVQ
jgi:hypothetical protein